MPALVYVSVKARKKKKAGRANAHFALEEEEGVELDRRAAGVLGHAVAVVHLVR